MNQSNDVNIFFDKMRESLVDHSFVKLTLSKSVGSNKDFKNVYARLIEIKGNIQLSFTLRYATKDEVKNFDLEDGIQQIKDWIGVQFLNADLFTTQEDVVLQLNKKRKARLFIKKPSIQTIPNIQHDRSKKRWLEVSNSLYLNEMGITNAAGNILKSGQKKFRQLNKYIEIIDSVLNNHPLPKHPKIVDMGSGKGYLTFALYDFLTRSKTINPTIVGIELREHLVSYCNDLAKQSNFKNLSFIAQDIMDFPADQMDMLIALHACDIATDLAIAKGIKANAEIIIVAPCCHKQIRKDMNCTNAMQSVLQHGILAERQAELLTDGIRSLLLEVHGYKTKVFEFISTEHTPKNVMIVATKSKPKPELLKQIAAIKKQFGITTHYLETLL